MERFLNSGVIDLGDRFGPLLWQFPPFKKFDEADFGSFLELLPKDFHGSRLRHVVEVRHASFCVPEFIRLLRKFETAVVFSEHETYPAIADVTADFLYLRLQKGEDTIATAYPEGAIADWAARLRAWTGGPAPPGPPRLQSAAPETKPPAHLLYLFPQR